MEQQVVYSGFSHPQQLTLQILGIAIQRYPEKLQQLLGWFGIATDPQPSPEELTDKVLYGITEKGQPFQWELAAILHGMVPGATRESNYTDSPYDTYVNLIAGAIGGIGQAIGSFTGRRQQRRQAKRQTLNAILAQRAHRQAAVEQAAEKEKAHRRKINLILLTGGLILAAGITYGLIQHNKTLKTGTHEPIAT